MFSGSALAFPPVVVHLRGFTIFADDMINYSLVIFLARYILLKLADTLI